MLLRLLGMTATCAAFVTFPTPRGTALSATMERPTPVPTEPLNQENYIAVGLAQVFMLNAGSSPTAQYLIEPLTAATLESLQLGVPTSYCRVLALTCGDLFDDVVEPAAINQDALAPLIDGFEDVKICENMIERSMAAARTFRRRIEATEFVPLYETSEDLNFNIERKRIMDQIYEPSFDDNVKQDRSIDVYGRSDDALADEIQRLAES